MTAHVLALAGLMATPDFETFLRRVVLMYPAETQLLLGEADVSPESATAQRHPDAWAYKLFAADTIVDHREFERAALGLRHFWDVMTDDYGNMMNLHIGRFRELQVWLARVLVTEEDVLTAVWAILFNDLGKLKAMQAHYKARYGRPHADHDVVMGTLMRDAPELFPGLNERQRDVLVPGFLSGFNLGQAVQLECPKASWKGFVALDDPSRNAFLVHAVFDFFGVTGAVDPACAKPFILNDTNVDAYLKVAMTPDYAAYALWRAALVGGDTFSVGILAGLLRLFTPEEGQMLETAFGTLKPIVRTMLLHELEQMGYDGPAILPYYAPALLAAARKLKPDPEGLALGLNILRAVLMRVREKDRVNHMPDGTVWIANLHVLATMLAKGEVPDTFTLRFEGVDGGVVVLANAVKTAA